jgi:hypothetical protein
MAKARTANRIAPLRGRLAHRRMAGAPGPARITYEALDRILDMTRVKRDVDAPSLLAHLRFAAELHGGSNTFPELEAKRTARAAKRYADAGRRLLLAMREEARLRQMFWRVPPDFAGEWAKIAGDRPSAAEERQQGAPPAPKRSHQTGCSALPAPRPRRSTGGYVEVTVRPEATAASRAAEHAFAATVTALPALVDGARALEKLYSTRSAGAQGRVQRDRTLIGGHLPALYAYYIGRNKKGEAARSPGGGSARDRFISAFCEEMGLGPRKPAAIDSARRRYLARLEKPCATPQPAPAPKPGHELWFDDIVARYGGRTTSSRKGHVSGKRKSSR